jgi:dethiobiotin synthetase
MIRIGVTGTDTGVGKTVVSCALAAGLRRAGLRVAALKPVETGVVFDDPARDGARLSRAAGEMLPLSLTAPITLPDPVAPLVAARATGTRIDLAALDDSLRAAASSADAVIVEGAGGLLVPVTEALAYDTLFAHWHLEVVLVAANRLGVINHTRLTIAHLRRCGLPLRAVILNQIDPHPDRSARDNAALLVELEHVRVIETPWLAAPYETDSLSDQLLSHVFPELAFAGGSLARR